MMDQPMWINLKSAVEVRAEGWQAEGRDADGHLVNCHVPFDDDEDILWYFKESMEQGLTVTIWPIGIAAPDKKWPTLKEAYLAALTAARIFEDAASVEETNWTGWGEQTVPHDATMRRVKAEQAVAALRDADPDMFAKAALASLPLHEGSGS